MKQLLVIKLCTFITMAFLLKADTSFLDTTFGPSFNGIVTTAIGTSAVAKAVAIQSDGKPVAAGNSDSRFATARYSTSGILDTASFNNPNGFITTSIGTNSFAYAVAQQTADLKIVSAGQAQTAGINSFALARYTTSGTLDATFDGDGIVTTTIGDSSAAFAMNVQTIAGTGRIVAAGYSFLAGVQRLAIARYLQSDGSLDASFNGSGTNTLLVGTRSVANAVAIQTDNNIVVAGLADVSNVEQVLVARYLGATGTLDTGGFGSPNGYVTTNIIPGMKAQAVGLQTIGGNAGKIIAAGSVNGKATLIRFNTDGSLDTTFGTDGDGGVRTTIGNSVFLTGLAVQSSNDAIVVTGYADDVVFVARFTATGALDSTFGSGGIAIVDVCSGSPSQGSNAVALDSSNRPVIAGYCDNQFMLARFVASGSQNVNNVELGKVAMVDSVYGNDTTGSVSGKPFLTVAAALTAAGAAASSTVPITVWVMPGQYTETTNLTIPSFVTLRGISPNVVIQRSVAVSADFVTMSTNSFIQNVAISLTGTGASAITLNGIVFAGASTSNASIQNVALTVDTSANTNAGSAGSGINNNGTGTPASTFMNVNNCSITISNNNHGGVCLYELNSGGVNTINVINTTMKGSSTATTNSQGVLNLKTGSTFNLYNCIINAEINGVQVAQASGVLTVNNCTINATAGTGMVNNGVGATLTATDCQVTSTGVGASNASTGTFNAVGCIITSSAGIGAQTNNASAVMNLNSCRISGSTADISQTAGSIIVTGTRLVNYNANALGFTVGDSPKSIVYNLTGNIGNGQTRFVRPGNAVAQNTETITQIRFTQSVLVKGFAVHFGTTNPPGAANTNTYTIRKNGVNTAVTLSQLGSSTSFSFNAASVSFAAGDLLSVQIVSGADAGGDVLITVEYY